ncbi:unnamed protein product [Arabidopsis halleri]
MEGESRNCIMGWVFQDQKATTLVIGFQVESFVGSPLNHARESNSSNQRDLRNSPRFIADLI